MWQTENTKEWKLHRIQTFLEDLKDEIDGHQNNGEKNPRFRDDNEGADRNNEGKGEKIMSKDGSDEWRNDAYPQEASRPSRKGCYYENRPPIGTRDPFCENEGR